jgi:hypothetical protein
MAAWDVMILNFDGHAPIPLGAFRPDHGPLPMGPADVVRADVDAALADVDWSDPRRGVLDDGGAPRIEIDLRGDEPLSTFVIHVLGPRGAAALIAYLCLVRGWAALDCARGVYLDLEAPETWAPGASPEA